MKNSTWEDEMVDAYVDDECSPEERAIVEARLRDDASAQDAAEWALRLRERMVATRAETPREFSQRLTTALNGADAWRRYDAARAQTRATAPSRAKWAPAVVGASAVAIAFAAFGLAYHNLSADRPTPTEPPQLSNVAPESVPEPVAPVPESPRPVIQTPASLSAPLPEAERPASQTTRWVVARLGDSSAHKALNAALQRRCAELNVDFMKFDSNRELLLQKLTPQAWRELRQTLEASGELEISDALQTWGAEGGESDRSDVRVTIMIAETPATE